MKPSKIFPTLDTRRQVPQRAQDRIRQAYIARRYWNSQRRGAAMCPASEALAYARQYIEKGGGGDWTPERHEDAREAALAADSMADAAAEEERDCNRAYDDGRLAGEKYADAEEARGEARDVIAGLREAKKSGAAIPAQIMSAARAQLCEAMESAREAAREARSLAADHDSPDLKDAFESGLQSA